MMTRTRDSQSSRQHLTFYLPGLFSAPSSNAGPEYTFSALETLLARSRHDEQSAAPGYEEGLFGLFGLRQEENTDLPVAAVTRMLDMGVIDNDWWLRADPVHLGLERDCLILADAQRLNVTRADADRLVAEVMDVFSADGWLLKAPRPERWYLKPARAPGMTTTALSRVVGRDVRPFLPSGPDGKSWHTTLNEIQILLHTTAVNSEREQCGKLPINSLWFWGGGRLPRITSVAWTQVWSNEPISLSLARLSGTPGESVPDGFGDWHSRAQPTGEHLVVLDQAQCAVLHADSAQWNGIFHGLENNWMAPVLEAVKSGDIAGVRLVTDTGRSFSLTTREARRWWRRRRPLTAYRSERD
ncbi:MAG: hypothetical protein ACYC9L_06025 [Sulfuricaulis sp.]